MLFWGFTQLLSQTELSPLPCGFSRTLNSLAWWGLLHHYQFTCLKDHTCQDCALRGSRVWSPTFPRTQSQHSIGTDWMGVMLTPSRCQSTYHKSRCSLIHQPGHRPCLRPKMLSLSISANRTATIYQLLYTLNFFASSKQLYFNMTSLCCAQTHAARN